VVAQRNMPEILIVSNATAFAPGDGRQEPTRLVVTTARAGVPPPGEVIAGESTAYVRQDIADAAVTSVQADAQGDAARGQATLIAGLQHQVDVLTREKDQLRAALVTAEEALTKAGASSG